jgi:ribosome-binding factor A
MQTKRNNRADRVAAEIKKVLSRFLLHNSVVDVADVNSSMISITEVVVSPCLGHAKVFVVSLCDVGGSFSLQKGEARKNSNEDCLAFLERHSSRLRRYLGDNLRLRRVPDLRFFIDENHLWQIEYWNSSCQP